MSINKLIPLAACLFSALAYGAEMYRWKDPSGTIHYGESAPPANQRDVRTIKVDSAAVTEKQRREAEELAAREKARLQRNARKGDAAAAPPKASDAAPAGGSKTPCEEEQRRFEESARCFNKFRVVGGGVSGGAAEECETVTISDQCR